MKVSAKDVEWIGEGWDQNPAYSKSIHKDAYIKPDWHIVDRDQIFRKSWQFVCHENQLPNAGDYIATHLHGQSIFICRQNDGSLKAFYNVCKHLSLLFVNDQNWVHKIPQLVKIEKNYYIHLILLLT